MELRKLEGIRRSDTPPSTIDARRICAVEGCATVLSRYNSDALCATHQNSPTSGGTRRRRRRPAWKDVEERLAGGMEGDGPEVA